MNFFIVWSGLFFGVFFIHTSYSEILSTELTNQIEEPSISPEEWAVPHCGLPITDTDVLQDYFLIAIGRDDSIHFINCLLENNQNINQIFSNGSTPLTFSIAEKRFEVVDFFIKNEADLNLTDINGNAPIHHAVLIEDIKLIKTLVNKKVNINIINNDGENSLDIAVRKRLLRISYYLLRKGADVNQARDSEGNTYLHLALQRRKIWLIRLLVKFGADPNLKNLKGQTSFDVAKEKNLMYIIQSQDLRRDTR